MNVLCSAGCSPVKAKDLLDSGECLECALEVGSPPCGFDYSFLRAVFNGNEDRSQEIHVTDITGCLRKAYWSKTAPLPEPVHSRFYASIGIGVHGKLEGDDPTGHYLSEVPVEGLGLIGRVDVFYPQIGRVLDIKTSRWITRSKLPYGSHALQVNIYALLLAEHGHTIRSLAIQYIDMSGPTKCYRHKVPCILVDGVAACPVCGNAYPDGHLGAILVDVPLMDAPALRQLVTERAGALKDALEHYHRPDAEASWLCKYCPFTGQCPEGERYINV